MAYQPLVCAHLLTHLSHAHRITLMRLDAHFEEVAMRFAGKATRKSRFRQFAIVGDLIFYEAARDELLIHHVGHGARRQPW